MARDGYIGVDGVARKIKAMYIGVDGVARLVRETYVGVDNIARKAWPEPVIPVADIQPMYNLDGDYGYSLAVYIIPSNATYQTVIWEIADNSEGVDATLGFNNEYGWGISSPGHSGNVILRAIIVNGLGYGRNFEKLVEVTFAGG